MRLILLFVCAFLVHFPIPTFTHDHALTIKVALPRMLLHSPPPHHNAHPSCETNSTIHFEEHHQPIFKATTTRASSSSSSSCKQTYGVMPCTHSIIGGIFLLGAYGYIIFRAARLLVEGSELLLVVLGPGIIGGLLLPIFGVLPDSILILVSGMGGSKTEAQDEVLIGVGLLAGSNVMLLTLLWGACLILGRCDLREGPNGNLHATNNTLTKRFDLLGTGIEVDKTTQCSAGIMCASIVPFIVVQLPHLFHVSKTNNIAVMIACLLSLVGLLTYSIYQVVTPGLKARKRLRALQVVFLFHLLKYNKEEKRLVDEYGNLDQDILHRMFDRLDTDNDGMLTVDEVRAMLTVSSITEKLNEEVVEHFMKDFDVNSSNAISWVEFLDGMKRWCKYIKPSHISYLHGHQVLQMEEYLEVQAIIEFQSKRQRDLTKTQLIRNSTFFLVMGTLLVSLFAEPLVDAVIAFSQSSHIPSFFVSFVLLPLASNSSEAISSIIFASRKQIINMSLTYSQIYGGVTMNNTMSLGILLAIIYARHLAWEFSSEVLIICVVTLVMGVMALIRRVLPLWIAGIALLLYPASIALVAILDYLVGWK